MKETWKAASKSLEEEEEENIVFPSVKKKKFE